MSVIASLQRANHGNHFRALTLHGINDLIDPFLGVDHAWMSGPTFPPHHHAGISAVSYLFLDSETGISNRDNIGTQNLIRAGGLHWMVAGNGIVHEEVPAETGKTVHSLQIFVNLPLELANGNPFALSIEPQDVPTVQLPGVKVRVPVGSYADVISPLNPPIEVTMLDISLEHDAELTVPISAGYSAFIMPIFGTITVDDQRFDLNDLKLPVFPSQAGPRVIVLRATNGSAKVMLFAGQPLRSTLN